MTSLDDFLRKGYFPKELLPPFTTVSFADVLNGPGAALGQGFQTSSCIRFSYSKYASLRRYLSIPNPYPFYELASCLQAHWGVIETRWSNSP